MLGIYRDFGDRYGIAQCLAGMIEVSGDGLSCVSINRPAGRERFGDSDLINVRFGPVSSIGQCNTSCSLLAGVSKAKVFRGR